MTEGIYPFEPGAYVSPQIPPVPGTAIRADHLVGQEPLRTVEAVTDPVTEPIELFPKVHQNVIAEVATLRNAGLDVNIVRPKPRYELGEGVQERVDAAVEIFEQPGDAADYLLRNEEDHKSVSVWRQLSKRAIALNTLYNPGGDTLTVGVSRDAFDKPLFDGKSARQIMEVEKPNRAAKILEDYDNLITTPIDDKPDGFGLSSRDYLTGVIDSHAVRTRADAAINRVQSYITEERPDLFQGRSLTSASLACGAAAPVFELQKRLAAAGVELDEIKLVDWDVMALASAASLAENTGVSDKVTVERRDLLKEELTDYIEPKSVDIVDMLGLFEYIPEEIGRGPLKYRAAEALLKKAGEIVRPGGLIVFGNMLDQRPQQKFFNKVWPRLYQRSVSKTLSMIEQAGFDPKDVTVDIPGDEGVYAVYTVRVGEELPQTTRQESLTQKASGWLVKKFIKEY